jgi:RND family efflux transporter MFP subunit
MKKILSASAIAVFLSITAYFLLASGTNEGGEISEHSYVVVQRKDLSQAVIATGIIKPKVDAEVKVGAQVSGVVKNLFVTTGSKVRKNDLLAVIDPRIYQSKKDQMLALNEIAATEKKYAELELNRAKIVYEQDVVSRQQFEAALQKFELAEAKLKQAEAEYRYADLQLEYTKIFSPIGGVVASISTREGETVAAGFLAPTFVTIIDLDQLELWAYVDETDIGRIQNGQSVSFAVDTYPGKPFEGKVETIYPKAEIQNNVVNYVTVVKIAALKDRILRPEMTATAQIFIQLKKNVLVLPKSAVQTENKKMFVTVLDNGKMEKRYILTGISDKKFYEVLSGVSEKEKVLLK